jgi:hypothetical protein
VPTQDKALAKRLRARGLRKKTAVAIARATNGGAKPKVARRAMADLASAMDEIDDRLRDGPERRSAAAK